MPLNEEKIIVTSVPGVEGLAVVLDGEYVEELRVVFEAVSARARAMQPGQGQDAILDLCSRLAPVFERFDKAMLERKRERLSIAEVQAEIDRLRKQLE